MSTPWLPKTALTNRANAAIVSRVVDDWCQQWLCQEELVSDLAWTRVEHSPDNLGDDGSRQIVVKGIGEANLPLASLILGREVVEGSLRKLADAELVEFVTRDALAALKRQLEQGLPTDQLTRKVESSFHALTFCINHDVPVLCIIVSQDVLIAMAKGQCPPSRAARQVFAPATGLPAQSVRLGAILGSVTTSFQDLRDLSVGDVIVLDEALEDCVDITINGIRKTRGAAFIETTNSNHSLVLERAVTQW